MVRNMCIYKGKTLRLNLHQLLFKNNGWGSVAVAVKFIGTTVEEVIELKEIIIFYFFTQFSSNFFARAIKFRKDTRMPSRCKTIARK